ARWLWRMPARPLLWITTHLACCWMMVFGPSTESLTYVLLMPALASALLLTRAWHWRLLAVCYSLFLLARLSNALGVWHWAVSGAVEPMAGLLFFLWALAAGYSSVMMAPRLETGQQEDGLRRLAA